MAVLDKEIKIIAVKGERGTDGQDGKSSYDLAVEELHYSGTLEEWIESFSTPENYITRDEFKKVTQAEYDALEQAHQLIPDCYYIITDDETYDELLERLDGIDETISGIQDDITTKYNSRFHTEELLVTIPSDNDTDDWVSCDLGGEIPLETPTSYSNILEFRGLIRKKSTVRSQGFILRVTDRQLYAQTTHAYDTYRNLMIVGTSDDRILLEFIYGYATHRDNLDIVFNKVMNIGNTGSDVSDYEYKILSVKELINY